MCGYFCIGFVDFMLAGKKLTDYTNLLSPYDFKKKADIIFTYLINECISINESNSIKAIDKTNLSEQSKIEIIGI